MSSIFRLFSFKNDLNIAEERTESGYRLIYKPQKATSSGSQLLIIPLKPETRITKEISISLIKFLSKEFSQKEIDVQLDSVISFVDCGQEFEKVICPNCDKEISMDSWQEFMDKASKYNFSDSSIKTNCCQFMTDLFSLKYQPDCGFAKSIITIFDPDSEINILKLLVDLKKISGTQMKLIYRRI